VERLKTNKRKAALAFLSALKNGRL